MLDYAPLAMTGPPPMFLEDVGPEGLIRFTPADELREMGLTYLDRVQSTRERP